MQTTSGNDGRFELAFPRPATGSGGPGIRPQRPGHRDGPGFGIGYYLHRKDQPIRLTEGDLPITGKLVDLEGRPVAGAKVRLGQVYLPLEKGSREKLDSMAGRLILDAEPLFPGGLKTDADGRFRIDGLGRDVLAALTLSGPTVAQKHVQVLTKSMDRFAKEPRNADLAGLDEPVIYGADCTIAVAPTRPIEGTVRDAENGMPIPGAVVTAEALSGSELNIVGAISTKTDDRGHYRLVGLPKEGARGHKLIVYPAARSALLRDRTA